MESYSSLPKPWGRARIDYSAVNEYIHAHYDSMEEQQSTSYFPQSIIEEDVYNAREGVFYYSQYLANPSLETCGFTLLQNDESISTKITDWTDWTQLCQHYFPQLDQSIRETLRQEQNDNLSIQHLVLWHPILRGTDLNITTTSKNTTNGKTSESKSAVVVQTASVASLVHIDTDIGALTLSQLLDLIQNNSIRYPNSQTFCRTTIEKDIENGCRFMIVNAWRNADTTSNNTPISSYPLGIFATQYYSNHTQQDEDDFDKNPHLTFFPMCRPDPHQSQWYTYPNMTTNECLLFKQYDRDASKMSDLWHCALNLVMPQQHQNRRSFDVRAFVVLKEKVSYNVDRWSHRHPSKLTLEESGCFCDEQAEKHKISNS